MFCISNDHSFILCNEKMVMLFKRLINENLCLFSLRFKVTVEMCLLNLMNDFFIELFLL